MDHIETRLDQIIDSVEAFKKPSFGQRILPIFTHALPILGVFLLLWLRRPEWMREHDANQVTQLFRDLGEWMAFVHLAGLLALVGVLAQVGRLRFSSASRNRKQFTWFACLLVLAAISARQLNYFYQVF